jgi:hypothetical protein
MLGRSALENEMWSTKDIEIDVKSTFSLVGNEAFKFQKFQTCTVVPLILHYPLLSPQFPPIIKARSTVL